MNTQQFLQEVENSVTPIHTTLLAKDQLLKAGYTEIFETEEWQNLPPKFFVNHDNLSLIAVNQVDNSKAVILQALTDSATFITKPNALRQSAKFEQVIVSPHGDGQWITWFDRDIGLAGTVLTSNGVQNVNLSPVGIIPSLAVHLNPGISSKPIFDIGKNYNPIIAFSSSSDDNSHDLIHLLSQALNISPDSILDYSLFVTDAQPPAILGGDKAFISGSRLSVLSTVLPCLHSFISTSPSSGTAILSITSSPNLPLMKRVLTKIFTQKTFRKTLFINATNGRAKAFNFSTDIDPHDVQIGLGPVINWAPRTTFGTEGDSLSLMKEIARKIDVKTQEFLLPNNVNLPQKPEAAEPASLGLESIEIGVPVHGFESIRQIAAIKDIESFQKLMTQIIKEPPTIF